MEIEIKEKTNNPFFKRTEVHFIIKHENQGTPNQAIIRNELAEVLNSKKELVIIDSIDSGFGIQQTRGYAKVYSSRKVAEQIENEHILKRNSIVEGKPKKAEDESSPKEKGEPPVTEAPKEEQAETPIPDTVKEEKKEKDSGTEKKEEES
jgi:small subunit ribosomal protein S24e